MRWAWAAVAVALALPARAHALDPACATSYAAAKEALEQRRLQDAIDGFRACLKATSDELTRWQMVLGIALAHDLMGRPLEAVRGYQDFLTRSAGRVDLPDRWRLRRQRVPREVERLERKVLVDRGRLIVTTRPPPGALRIDGRARGELPPEPSRRVFYLPPGRYTVEVDKAGWQGFRRTVTLAAGQRLDLHARFERPAQKPSPVPEPRVRTGDDGRPFRLAGWASIGAGAGMVALGGLMTGLALADVGELEDLQIQPVTGETLARDADLRDRVGRLETASWVLYGLGAAALVTGSVLLALHWSDGEERVQLIPGPGSAVLLGRF